jgi:hypothetical protein
MAADWYLPGELVEGSYACGSRAEHGFESENAVRSTSRESLPLPSIDWQGRVLRRDEYSDGQLDDNRRTHR